jgi:hypothetical protein
MHDDAALALTGGFSSLPKRIDPSAGGELGSKFRSAERATGTISDVVLQFRPDR